MAMKNEKPVIGVFVCHCGMNIAPKVDVEAVAGFAQELNHVHIAREYKFMCSNPGQELIKEDINKYGLNRVVVASCSPRMHEITFRKACESAGLNPYYFQMANIREHSSWVTKDSRDATEKAKDLVAAAAARVYYHRPLQTHEVSVNKSVVVIGGGIAGIQAALTSAEADFTVHLVEREPSIGGHMSKFDKTFPTLDCAACISTPKTVSVGQHPDISLYSYSEVVGVEGFVGNYNVAIKRKPRYISEDKCTGCGLCVDECPVEVVSSFDEGLTHRKAVYRSFPQAVPLTFCIEKKDPAPCVTTCPAGLNVQGYVQMVKAGKYQQALNIIMKRIPLPGVLGRICPHPCETDCRRALVDSPVSIRNLKRFAADNAKLEDVPRPEVEEIDKQIAIIGSGPAGLTVAYYLRLKGYKVTIFEAMEKPGGMLRCGIPDFRLPQEILDQEIGNIISTGVELKTDMALGRDFTLSDLKAQGFDAIFLGIGAHIPVKMNIENEDANGVVDAVPFLRRENLEGAKSAKKRVVVIGGGNVAMDAARVAIRSGAESVSIIYRRTEKEMPADQEEIKDAKEEGIQFVNLVGPKRVVTENGKVVGIECIQNELGPVDDSGRRRPVPVKGSEYVINCDMVIPAIGQRVGTDAIANDTDLDLTAWGTFNVDNLTLQTSEPGIFAAGDSVTGPATVIEAIAAGHKAVKAIERYINNELEVFEAEKTLEAVDPVKEDFLPIPENVSEVERAKPKRIEPSARKNSYEEVNRGLDEVSAQSDAEKCLNCGGCCECHECVRVCEVSAVDHEPNEEIIHVEAGAIIMATGFKTFDPTPLNQYGYGRFPEVYTSLEFERLNNATGPTGGKILMKNGEPPKKVAIIHCVGSRDSRHRKYCSRVCCMYSMKFAHLIREKTGSEVWEYYIDIRSPGKLYEEFYNRVQEEGVHFIRGKVAEITDIPDDPSEIGRLTVVAENTLTRRTSREAVDMVILSVGLEPSEGADELGRLIGVSRDGDGWFSELHAKLAPVSTPISGIYLAGSCQGPKDIPDTVAQAMGAAGEAVALLSKGTVKTQAEISNIDPDLCTGCRTCIGVCSYSAISFDENLGIAKVNDALCHGCGSCAAACPSSSAAVCQFTDNQVMHELEELLL
jgi:heterodisulfide reductase subunit A2